MHRMCVETVSGSVYCSAEAEELLPEHEDGLESMASNLDNVKHLSLITDKGKVYFYPRNVAAIWFEEVKV